MRTQRRCTEPTQCRSCSEQILWVVWASGKKMPVDAAADNVKGNVVLSIRGGEYGQLVAENFDQERHGQRNRYVSHFSTCPESKEWRKGATP